MTEQHTDVVPFDPAVMAEIQPFADAYRNGELTAAGLARLLRPICDTHAIDSGEALAWVIGQAQPEVPTQRQPGDAITLTLPRDPRRLSKKWLVVAAGVVALGVAGGGAVLALAHSAGASTRTVSGTLTLMEGSSGSYLDGDYSTNYTTSGGSCSGSDGYDDIAGGAAVTVHDAAGKVIAQGTLDPGVDAGGACTFAFSVPNVPTSKFYGIEVSHRGTVDFPASQAGDAEISLGS